MNRSRTFKNIVELGKRRGLVELDEAPRFVKIAEHRDLVCHTERTVLPKLTALKKKARLFRDGLP